MARPKSVNTSTENTVDTVENTVNTVAENPEVKTPESTAEEKKDTVENTVTKKEIKDDDQVVIVSKSRAGKKIIAIEGSITFDEKGMATVSGKVAKYLLGAPDFKIK